MSVLAGTANLKPDVISSFKLSFEKKKLANQLNKASKQLVLTHQDYTETKLQQHEVKVAGLLNESLSQICSILNAKNNETRFIPSVGIFSSKADIFKEKLLLIIDPQSPDSIRAYQILINRILNGDLVINQLY